jgi:hypothetical protein
MGLPIRPIGPLTSCHHPTTVPLLKMVMMLPRSAMNAACNAEILIAIGLFIFSY